MMVLLLHDPRWGMVPAGWLWYPQCNTGREEMQEENFKTFQKIAEVRNLIKNKGPTAVENDKLPKRGGIFLG